MAIRDWDIGTGGDGDGCGGRISRRVGVGVRGS